MQSHGARILPSTPLCRRDRFKNPACTAKPINPPWTPPVYRFIGLSAQATPPVRPHGLRPFIGLSVYRRGHPASQAPWASPVYRFIGLSARPPRQSDPMGFARLSVYRFIGAATPPVRPHGLRPLIGLSVYRRRPPLGPARLSVYRFIGAATPSARPRARQARPPPWAYPVHRFIEERILLEKSCMYKF